MPGEGYERRVFINAPFDPDYRLLFDAIVFAVTDCGYIPRCARERDDGGEIRFDKLITLIGDCRFGLHDISRVDLDPATSLPRFNMPLELGLFLGASRFGSGKQRRKTALILDLESNRYDKFISDISGQDIKAHGNNPTLAIKAVRNWLATNTKDVLMPTGDRMAERYAHFDADLPELCDQFHMSRSEITFLDYRQLIREWLMEDSWGSIIRPAPRPRRGA